MSLRGSAGQPTHWLPVSVSGLCEAWRGLLYVEEGEGAITSLPEMGESFTGCLAHSLDLGRVSCLIAHIKSIFGLISHNIHNKWIFNDHKPVIMRATIHNIRSMMRAMPGLRKRDLGPEWFRFAVRWFRAISSRAVLGLKRICGACSIQWAASTRILRAQIRSLLVLLVMIAFTAQAQTPDTRPDFLPAGATFVDGKIVWETDLQVKVSAAWEAKAKAEMDAAVAWETLAQGHDAVSAAWEAAEEDPGALDAIDSLRAKMSAQRMSEAAEADSVEAERLLAEARGWASDWREAVSRRRESASQAREWAAQARDGASQARELASQASVNDSWTKEQVADWRSGALSWRDGASQARELASLLRNYASDGRRYASALQGVAVDVARMFQAGSEVREATAEAWEVLAEANEATAEAWEAAVEAWEAVAVGVCGGEAGNELQKLVAAAFAAEAVAHAMFGREDNNANYHDAASFRKKALQAHDDAERACRDDAFAQDVVLEADSKIWQMRNEGDFYHGGVRYRVDVDEAYKAAAEAWKATKKASGRNPIRTQVAAAYEAEARAWDAEADFDFVYWDGFNGDKKNKASDARMNAWEATGAGDFRPQANFVREQASRAHLHVLRARENASRWRRVAGSETGGLKELANKAAAAWESAAQAWEAVGK